MKQLLLILAIALSSLGYAQTSAVDCSFAIPVCTNTGFTVSPNGPGVNELPAGTTVNPNTNPASTNSGCLLTGETNSTWMVVNISTAGTLEFSFGTSGLGGCLDWIMFPYTSATCGQISSNSISPIRCNWNGNCDGFTGIAASLPFGAFASNFEPPLNVNCGEQYLICLSNYSSVTTNVPLDFFGTATVACSTFNPITVSADTTICSGQPVTLTATGGVTYNWSPSGSLSASTGATVTATPTTTTTYQVIGTGTCGTDTAYVTITVNQCCTVTATGTNNICQTDTLFLTGTGTAGSTYSWSGPSGFSSSLQNPFIVNPVSGVYTVTLTNGLCVISDTVNINIIQCCQVIGANNGPVCQGELLTLTALGSPMGGTYSWSGPSGFTSTSQNFISSNTNLSTGNYIVTYTTGLCIISDTILITVNPKPTAAFTFDPDKIDFDYNQPIQFTDQSFNSITSWQWLFGDNGTSSLQNPTYQYADTGTYNVQLIVTTASGCSDTIQAQFIVELYYYFYVPNAFTPDSDNLNETFLPIVSGAKNYTLLIFNRWGELLFETSDMNQGWDGQHKSQLVKQDVYVWKITLTDNKNDRKTYVGHVTVIK